MELSSGIPGPGGGSDKSPTFPPADLSLLDELDLRRFVKEIYREVQHRRNKRQANRLECALTESRDAVLLKRSTVGSERNEAATTCRRYRISSLARGKSHANSDKTSHDDDAVGDHVSTGGNWRGRIYKRLPSNSCPQPPVLANLLCLSSPSHDAINDNGKHAIESPKLNDGADRDVTQPTIASGTDVTKKIQDEASEEVTKSRAGKEEEDQSCISVRMRGTKNRWGKTQSVSPIVYLEGTHEPRPLSSATIFLKTHYYTEDEKDLTYVPYFGDDDKEDFSDVFDLSRRQKLMEFGPEYQERDTNDAIDETIRLLKEKIGEGQKGGNENIYYGAVEPGQSMPLKDTNGSGGSTSNQSKGIVRRINKALAVAMNVNIDRISERYKACFAVDASTVSIGRSQSSDSNDNNNNKEKEGGGASVASSEETVGKTKRTKSPSKDCSQSSASTMGSSSSSPASPSLGVRNSDVGKVLPYEEVMDSYRNLFCRRCFSYDCNIHGNLDKPNIELQGELAVQKEREGYWDKIAAEESSADFDANATDAPLEYEQTESKKDDATCDSAQSILQNSSSPSRKRPWLSVSPSAGEINGDKGVELTSLQKSICDRVFMVFQGDVDKIARAIGSQTDLVARYVAEKKLVLKEPTHIPTETAADAKKKKRKGVDKTSMKHYNVAWLKRVEGAEIHPAFMPCDHEGLCSEVNCSCVQNAFFCTKHCVWGSLSRNFFRGCACKGGQCRTKSCACFAAKRECDPDLCRTCGACTDPPNKPAVRQRCRNDNIGMRRHCHLLLAKSSIEDAGWGIFTRHALKKGDFVHEYVGEVISQEEAERRGRIYDKVNRSYLFNLSSDFVVDASRKGNKTKFANHSSKPNCYTKMVSVNGDIRIGLFAKEDIEPQSELFFDYRYDAEMDNDLIIKSGKTVDWMKNPKMANKISKKYA